MAYTTDTFLTTVRPLQTANKKDEAWRFKNIDYYAGELGNSGIRVNELNVLYKAAEGVIDAADYKHLTNPYNTTNSRYTRHAAKIRNYDILSPVIKMFMGERSSVPNNYQAVSTHSGEENDYTNTLNAALKTAAQQMFVNELNDQGYPTGLDSKEVKSGEEIKEEVTSNFYDEEADVAQTSLDYLIYDLNMDETMQNAYYHWLVSGRVFTYKYIYRNDVKYVILDPRNCRYGDSMREKNVEDFEYFTNVEFWNGNEVIDRFRSDLTKEDIEWIDSEESKRQSYGDVTYNSDYASSITDSNLKQGGTIRVAHTAWMSLKEIKILTYKDPLTGELVEKEVDVTYKLNKDFGDISIETEFISEARDGWKIGNSEYVIYIGGFPLETQRSELNNSSNCKLPFNGRVWRTHTGEISSIIKIGMPYQILYNGFHFNYEKSVARNKDSIIVMPMGLMPNKPGWDEERFMYFVDDHGYLFFDESKPGAAAAIQGIKVMNTALGDYVSKMMDLLRSIRAEWWEAVGMNANRYGDIGVSQGKGTNEQAIHQSATVTAEMNREFDKFQEFEYQGLLDHSRVAWRDGKKGKWINTDKQQKRFTIADGLAYLGTEMTVFVKNNGEETAKLKTFQQQAFAFAQNGGSPTMIAEILDSRNFSRIKNKVAEFEKMQQQLTKEAAEKEQDTQKYISDQAATTAQSEQEFEKYKIDTTNQTKIEIANIQARAKRESDLLNQYNGDSTSEGVTDDIDIDSMLADMSAAGNKRGDAANASLDKASDNRRKNAENYDNASIKREKMSSDERIARENKNRFDK